VSKISNSAILLNLVGVLLLAWPAAAQELTVPPVDIMVEPLEPVTISATVMRVIDGSTLDVSIDGVRTAVGYLGIDTPPLNAACGPEARNRNQLLVGGQVLLQEEPNYAFDTLGRRLFYVFTADGTSVEDELIREGLGVAARVDGFRGEEMLMLEDETAALSRGCLWSISTF
jgi:endonuclease YncB( thermonuclease family)